jgi:hypothetical protein
MPSSRPRSNQASVTALDWLPPSTCSAVTATLSGVEADMAAPACLAAAPEDKDGALGWGIDGAPEFQPVARAELIEWLGFTLQAEAYALREEKAAPGCLLIGIGQPNFRAQPMMMLEG